MIFDFALDPIEDVLPWGDPNDQKIDWFALTQGIYRLKVGEEYLFNYSDEYIAHSAKDHPPANDRETYVNYYAARLWEDILAILPQILEPVPKDLQYKLKFDSKGWQGWLRHVDRWHEDRVNKNFDDNQVRYISDLATGWIKDRCLDAGYLSPPARIWIWSDEKNVFFNWDNQEFVVEEIPVWTAKSGNYQIERDEFIREVQEFNDKVFEQMDRRIEEICRTSNNSEIQVDLESLRAEQTNRSTWLETWLKSNRQTDWNAVNTAMDLISP